MKTEKRRIALVWIYVGQSPSERLESIGTVDAGHMELIAVGNVHVQRAVELFSFANPDRAVRAVESVSMAHLWDAVPDDVGALVFWIDDEKLVSPGFGLEMAKPLLAEDPSREQHLHYWDGNALAISRSMAESVALRDMSLRGDCLLTFMSDIVERSCGVAGSQVKLMFSPLEKFAAMAMEAVGVPSSGPALPD